MITEKSVTIDELRQIILDSSRFGVGNRIWRREYFDWCQSGLDNDFIKVITGFRRVGKSFLLKQLSQYLIQQKGVPQSNIFFVNFEHDLLAGRNTVGNLRKMVEMFESQIAQNGKVYLFLDEVQNVPYWEKFVRTVYDADKSRYSLYITGSNSALLSGEFSTSLSGRTIQMQVNVFSFVEYLEILGIHIADEFDKVARKSELQKHLMRYLHLGGLPETIARTDDEVRQYIQSLFRKVLLDDIVKRFKIEKVFVIEKLLGFIFANVGSVTSLTNIANVLENAGERVSVPTLGHYMELYEQAFVVDKIKKFDWSTKKVFDKLYKFYALDNGLISVIGAGQIAQTRLLENLVYNTLRKRYGSEIYYGRNNDEKEIDFVVVQGKGEFVKVQVSRELGEQNIRRELGNFVIADKYLQKGENVLVVLEGTSQTHEYKGVTIKEITLLDFLLER